MSGLYVMADVKSTKAESLFITHLSLVACAELLNPVDVCIIGKMLIIIGETSTKGNIKDTQVEGCLALYTESRQTNVPACILRRG